MTGEEFKRIRKLFGLKKPDWMYALGYAGSKNTMFLNCDRYENGTRQIPLYLARYVWLLGQLAETDDACAVKLGFPGTTKPFPIWPEWPGYHLDEEKVTP